MMAFLLGVLTGIVLSTAASGAAAWLIHYGWGTWPWDKEP